MIYLIICLYLNTCHRILISFHGHSRHRLIFLIIILLLTSLFLWYNNCRFITSSKINHLNHFIILNNCFDILSSIHYFQYLLFTIRIPKLVNIIVIIDTYHKFDIIIATWRVLPISGLMKQSISVTTDATQRLCMIA